MKLTIFLVSISALITAMVILTTPRPFTDIPQANRAGDPVRGERFFDIAGCGFCHVPPANSDLAGNVLSGGQGFPTVYGTYYAPNISPDPVFGIGDWTNLDMVNALKRGVSPEGTHYFPLFPYDSYSRMNNSDIIDIFAYILTLPESQAENLPHDLPLRFQSRRSIGIWKFLYLRENPVVPTSQQVLRGRYLVEGPGHCAECHTPRNFLGGMKRDLWLSGRYNPEIDLLYPNLTPHSEGLGDWSEQDIVMYLRDSNDPDSTVAHGYLSRAVDTTKYLNEKDLNAIAAYLKAIPAVPSSATTP